MTNVIKFFIGGALALHLSGVALGQFADDFFSGRMKVKAVVVPLYVGTEQTPSMVVQVDDMFRDYERKGFFRIGFLPLGVMQGVSLEIRHPSQAANALAQLHDRISAQASKHFEFRKVTFLTLGGYTNRLESGRARIVAADKWELLDGVSFSSGTNRVEAPRATLQVAGAEVGRIIIATTPPLTNNLFADGKNPTIQEKGTP